MQKHKGTFFTRLPKMEIGKMFVFCVTTFEPMTHSAPQNDLSFVKVVVGGKMARNCHKKAIYHFT